MRIEPKSHEKQKINYFNTRRDPQIRPHEFLFIAKIGVAHQLREAKAHIAGKEGRDMSEVAE